MVDCQVITNETWDHYRKENPDIPFMQSNFWCEFREKVGWKSWKLGIFEGGKMVAGCAILKFVGNGKEKTNFLSIPEGPHLQLGGNKAAKYWKAMLTYIEEKIVDHEPDQNTTYLRIEPRTELKPDFFKDFQNAPETFEPRNTLVINLTRTEEALLKQMHAKGRYNVKVAQKHGVTVSEGLDRSNVENFLELYEGTVGRKKFPSKQKFYFEKLLPILEREKTGTIFVAKHGETPLAAALVILFGKRATYFFGGSSEKHREMMAPYLLHWEIMRFAKTAGYKEYDLWGIAPENVPNHPWKDITTFKKKFGGKKLHFLHSLDKVYDSESYREKYLDR